MLDHSVLSDSLPSCGLKPARLLCPWGFSRQAYGSGWPCPPPGDLPNPGIKPRSPALQVDSSLAELPGKPCSEAGYWQRPLAEVTWGGMESLLWGEGRKQRRVTLEGPPHTTACPRNCKAWGFILDLPISLLGRLLSLESIPSLSRKPTSACLPAVGLFSPCYGLNVCVLSNCMH